MTCKTKDAIQSPWAKIVADWCARPGRTGPTFPYILGATQQPVGAPFAANEYARASLGRLWEEMRAGLGPGRAIDIRYCAVIRQPVVVLESFHVPDCGQAADPWAAYALDPLPPFAVHLAGLSESQALGYLWKLHGEDLMACRFSYCSGSFREFCAAELAEIRAALAAV